MFLRRQLLSVAFLISLFTGCTTGPVNSNSNTASVPPSTSSTSPSPSPSASPATTSTASLQITLPLLDALLSDEKFVDQLKTKLKLSDDKIDALKRVSSAEIARLRETNAEETADGDSGDPRARAEEQLRSVLGDDKTNQLVSIANDYWARGGEPATGGAQMLPGPNAVPTDTRIVVNIPAFRMDLFQDGNLIKSYKVGIGYPEFPLPFGLRKAQTIIFNPTWTPPDSPWVAKMKNAVPGQTIQPGDKDNPLGPIKIPIGLPSLIHGGKSPSRIGKFASHGCVGLTTNQIKDFALLLSKAGGADLTQQKMVSYLQDKDQTKTVKLDQPVPVELRYETIVLEDGKLHIYKDVYEQDTNNEENLRRVLEAQGLKLEDLSEQQRTEALNALNAMSAHPRANSSPSPSPTAAKRRRPAKAQTEIVIDISNLNKKGYPAPVDLDEGRR